MAPLTDQQASIVALYLESTAWGIFLVTFGLCLRSLLFSKSGLKPFSEINRPMFAVCLIMPIFATVNMAINTKRALDSVGPRGISEQFTDLGSAIEIVKFSCVNLQTLVADGILTYRCWIVYGKSWMIAAAPVLLWIGVLGTTTANIYLLSTIHSEALTAATKLRPVVTSFWVISIALNIITTALIVLRIFAVDRKVTFQPMSGISISRSERRFNALQRTMRIIVESGAIYTGIAIITFATYVSGNVGVYITSALEVQTAGIAFNLVIIRVHSRTYQDETKAMTELRFSLRSRWDVETSPTKPQDGESTVDDKGVDSDSRAAPLR
ncbi:uncharacterized protein BT62DRAFT_1079035 [Guyanagaster necrorhizus]|uniref:Uncharacterized protein n=1 Tax=Guyanagaster necrorhizus TaxID=856835 RepID=A0A9P7VLL1_9AGAR|nr:uncharacterized protein BT62DRAFT_1079035 [Guyanagaster necrorhizus MCA 3950]KAG7442944.1 hypothetical protein BT62DRAFT_1079035 [Guyanagaster necrorhizus MCA 3950]